MSTKTIFTFALFVCLLAGAATPAWCQDKLDQLDLTIEVMTDDMESAEDLVNTITLPTQLRDRVQDNDGKPSPEMAKEKIDELHAPLDEMRNDIIEQQAESIQSMKELQGGNGGRGPGR